MCNTCYLKLISFFSIVLGHSYGMRYMAKVMRSSLHARFPEAHEKDILKVCECCNFLNESTNEWEILDCFKHLAQNQQIKSYLYKSVAGLFLGN